MLEIWKFFAPFSIIFGFLVGKLSISALDELIENQKQVIDQQKAYLARLDLAIDNDQQREVIQVIIHKLILVL